MGQFFSWVKSNEKEILVTLDNLAKKSVQISEELVIMLTDLKINECHKKIHTIETEADKLVRDIFSELNRTFITPLDREDMQRVASKIDDTIDHIDGIAARLQTYKITKEEIDENYNNIVMIVRPSLNIHLKDLKNIVGGNLIYSLW